MNEPLQSLPANEDRVAQRLVRRVLAQWWLVLICAVVAAGAAYLASSARTPLYAATSTLEIGEADLISVYLADSVIVRDNDPDRIKSGAIEQFSLPNVRDRASGTIGGALTPGQIGKQTRIESVANSSVVKVVATNKDPRLAQQTANALVGAFITQRQELARQQIVKAKSATRRQLEAVSDRESPTAKALRERLTRIGVLGSLDTGNVTVIQGARKPTTAVSPKPKRDALLGLLAGGLLGLAIALLRARLDDRIRDADELAEYWNLPVAGLVPQSGSLKTGGAVLPEPAALEALSLARTNLRYLHVGGRLKTILLTSALEQEGKSTLTWNLGVAAALASAKVLVIEADMRRPRLSGRLNIGGSGFSELLAGIATVDEVIQRVDVKGADGQVATSVDVIAAGLTPPSPIALLEGNLSREALAEVRGRYDLVLIDTPPATVVGDAVALVGDVDGVIVVSRLGRVRRGAYARLRDILLGADAPVVAQVINSDANAKNYGYYSSYTAPVRGKAKQQPEAAANA